MNTAPRPWRLPGTPTMPNGRQVPRVTEMLSPRISRRTCPGGHRHIPATSERSTAVHSLVAGCLYSPPLHWTGSPSPALRLRQSSRGPRALADRDRSQEASSPAGARNTSRHSTRPPAYFAVPTGREANRYL